MDLHKNGHPQPFMYMLSNKHRHGVIIFVHSRPAILNQFSICFTFYSKTINKSFRMDMVHNNLHRTRSVFIKSIDGLTSTALALSLSTTSPHYQNFIRINSPNTTLKQLMIAILCHQGLNICRLSFKTGEKTVLLRRFLKANIPQN